MPKDSKLHSINGVEIFSAGVWNGDEYTEKDIDLMVSAFEDTSENIRPYLKLGHDKDQKLVQKDGLPAAGWIGKIYRDGNKLMADFIDIPNKIFTLIENKAYRSVSAEIFWNLKIGEKIYKRMLSAVSLLGANTPAVMNLDDILSLYGLNYDSVKTYNNEYEDLKIYSFTEEKQMDEKLQKELDELKSKNEELETQAKDYTQKDEVIEELKAYKEEAEKKIEDSEIKLAEVEQLKKDEEHKNYKSSLEKMGLTCPASEKFIDELVKETKEYTIDEESMNVQGLIEGLLKVSKEAFSVNMEESSEEVEQEKKKDPEEVRFEAIEEIVKSKNVPYADAILEYDATNKE